MDQMFQNCQSLSYIDLRNLEKRSWYAANAFDGLPDVGTLIYDSSKCQTALLYFVPSGWTKINIKE